MFPAGVGKGVSKCNRNCTKGIVEIELHNTTKTAPCPLSTLLKTVPGSFGRPILLVLFCRCSSSVCPGGKRSRAEWPSLPGCARH